MGKAIYIHFRVPDYHSVESLLQGALASESFLPTGLIAQTFDAQRKQRRLFLAGFGWQSPSQMSDWNIPDDGVFLCESADPAVMKQLQATAAALRLGGPFVEPSTFRSTNDSPTTFRLGSAVLEACDKWCDTRRSIFGELAGSFTVEEITGMGNSPERIERLLTLRFSRSVDGTRKYSSVLLSALTEAWLEGGVYAGRSIGIDAAERNLARLVEFCMLLRERMSVPVAEVLLRLDGVAFMRESTRIEKAFSPLDVMLDY